MIGLGGDAPTMLGILWALTGVTLIFVLLRLYTRIKVVESYGLDDHFFNASFVCMFPGWLAKAHATGHAPRLRCHAHDILLVRFRP